MNAFKSNNSALSGARSCGPSGTSIGAGVGQPHEAV